MLTNLKDLPNNSYFRLEDAGTFHLFKNRSEDQIYAKRAGYIYLVPENTFLGHLPFDASVSRTIKVTKIEDESISLTTRLHTLPPRETNTTGTDPEIFVVDKEDKLLPAFQFLPSQTEAKAFHGYKYSYAYRDGFAAECYVGPNICHGFLMDNIRNGLKKTLEMAREQDSQAKLTIQSSFQISKEVMDAASDDDVAFGCEPSFNVYGTSPAPTMLPREFPFRFTGGHIHFAMPIAKDRLKRIVKACDLFGALPAVGLFASFDSPHRRLSYGRAGEHRLPSYGLEYRTLSNAWLSDPRIAHLTFNLVRGAVRASQVVDPDVLMSDEQLQDIINNCDVTAARKFFAENVNGYNGILKCESGVNYPDTFKKAVLNGIESVVKEPKNIERNWLLNSNWATHSHGDAKTWGALCRAR